MEAAPGAGCSASVLDFQRRPERFIWPAVHWMVIDQMVVAALVYRKRLEVFWAEQVVVALSPGELDVRAHAFWERTFFELGGRLRVVNAWTGAPRATFPAPCAERVAVERVSMRGLFPDAGAPAFGEAASRRALLEPALVLRLTHAELAFAIGAARAT